MTTVPCTLHPDLAATVRVGARYLCGDCLRDERPILFVTLPRVPEDDEVSDGPLRPDAGKRIWS